MSNLTLSVEILGEFRKLTAATKGAESQLQTMGKKAATISKGINRAFAGIGIGLSFTLLAREVGEATKAAVEDRKSQELLALAMRNTAGASNDQIAAAEKAINKFQFSTSIADDKLRPAYQKLFLATGDVTKANDLLAIALDTSASTGKDLDTVSQAMAKSLAGSDGALAKLIPSVKDSKTPIEDMGKAFEGAAIQASKQDPYQNMQTIFGDIQEKIGTALLPVLDDFAAWMSSPPGQAQLQEIADAARDILTELAAVGKWAIANKNWLLPLAVSAGIFSGTVTAINGIATAVTGVTTAVTLLKTATGGTLLAALGALGIGAAGSAAGGYFQGKALAEQSAIYGQGGTKLDPFAGLGKIGSGGFVPAPTPKTGMSPRVAERSNVVNIYTPKVDAAGIVNTLNTANRNGFTGSIRVSERQ